MLKNKSLIGIHGKLGAGKDTVATVIQALCPRQYTSNSFARPLKEGVKAMFGWTDRELEDRSIKEAVDEFWEFSPRLAMQLLGTEYGRRGLRDDIWIRAAEKYYQSCQASGAGVIMTDVRFENEAEWIRSKPNSILIHVVDPNALWVDPETLHPSERGVAFDKGLDYYFVNDKTLGVANIWKGVNQMLDPNMFD